MLYDYDILNYSLCVDGLGSVVLGEEGGQFRENKEWIGSWVVIQGGSYKKGGDGFISWCYKNSLRFML